MYRILVIAAIAGVALAISTKKSDPSIKQAIQEQQPHIGGPLATPESNQSPVYTGSGQPNAQSMQYFYPRYPVYPQETGYGVQTGYEGYLIPPEQRNADESWTSSMFTALAPVSGFALSHGAKVFLYLWKALLLVLAGGAITTAVCTFTSLCSITFAGYNLSRNKMTEQVSELARAYVTPRNLDVATKIVKTAIDQYAQLQMNSEKSTTEKTEIKERRRR